MDGAGGTTLRAGAARRTINPPLGTRQTGFRLFGNPVQAIESDLTATALVLAAGATRLVLIAIDLSLVGIDLSLRGRRPAQAMREEVAAALAIPASHVLLNTSHTHAGVALPDYMPDTDEQLALKERYRRSLTRSLVEATLEADARLRPARIGWGWGSCPIGVYRRETRHGRLVLGEAPGHPVDDSVGVIRVDDLDGAPIAVAFRSSCHPVTMGPRSAVVSSDFPGVARAVVERSLGGLALFLQGGGGNVNPRAGMGFEVDCRDTKHRVGLELGGEVVKVAARIRTATRRGERRTLGNVPDVLVAPWEPVGADGVKLAAAESSVRLDYVELPSRERAEEILSERRRLVAGRRAGDAQEWELRVAEKQEDWARLLVEAVGHEHPGCDLFLQAFRVGEVVVLGLNAELFFETGLELRARSPLPGSTFVLGYTNGTIGYLPRAEDHPPGGWRLDAAYAVPDLIFQVHPHPVALHPGSERRAVEAGLALLATLGLTGGRS